MLGWCIRLGLLAILLLLLFTPLVLSVDYDDPNERYDWKLSWFGILLISSENKGLWYYLQKRKKLEDTENISKEKSKKALRKGKLKLYWKKISTYLPMIPKVLRLLWKGITVRNLVIGVQIGRFDAKDCAAAYGAVNALVYTSLGLLKSCMRLNLRQVCVQCVFGKDVFQWIIRGKVYFIPLAGVAALLSLIWAMVMQSRKEQQEQENQSAENMQMVE